MAELRPHPDRLATTLADCLAPGPGGPFAPPGPDARAARIDLKLRVAAFQAAAARSPAAAAHLAHWPAAAHPDLWAGAVPDLVARAFAVRLEEAIALAGPAPSAELPPFDPLRDQHFSGRELRKKKDLLVASATARVRFSRKEGLLCVLRDDALHVANCLWFDARRDLGTLDHFVPDPAERPRLFSAQFLQPREYQVGGTTTRLRLTGRLGRGPIGWPCELEIAASREQAGVALRLRLEHRHPGWRLRARFRGVPAGLLRHQCTDVADAVAQPSGGFLAYTLVRSCERLTVGAHSVAVPAAQCLGRLEHTFTLG
ncbi:MAG: hypothetical protein JNK49_01520 [Planctomycetes bacterium]|nr:hypothetical protein [Planctomycetota bacterium]